MKIQLLYFQGCPNVDASRAAIREALAIEQVAAYVEQIDVEAPDAPAWVRGWGSPTILINGIDVAGQPRSEAAAACRLYANGAPSVDTIRERIKAAHSVPFASRRGVALPMIGAVTAAIAASACCLIPAVLAIIGVSGAGLGASLAPYRVYFLIATALALTTGFCFAYRRRPDACGCEAPMSRRAARVGLWITTLISVALVGYPLFGSGYATVGGSDVEAKATLRLKVTGMDCAECTSTIANRIKQVPGVVSASVDFESGIAIVRYDGRDGMDRAAIDAVENAGFTAEVQP